MFAFWVACLFSVTVVSATSPETKEDDLSNDDLNAMINFLDKILVEDGFDDNIVEDTNSVEEHSQSNMDELIDGISYLLQ